MTHNWSLERERDRETERERERQRQRDRETERQRDREREKPLFWSIFSCFLCKHPTIFFQNRIDYYNIKTRETINVSTNVVVHYFSQWPSFWSVCDCKNFTKLVPSQTPSRSSHRRCSVKKLFLKICETLQENTCVGVFFNKVAGLQIY